MQAREANSDNEVYLEAQSSFEGKIYLDVEPHPVLPIRVIPNGTTTNYLTLKNFNLSSVSFKMKTTNPNIYTVCPNVGVLHPGEKTQLKIEICLPSDFNIDRLNRDKMLIQTINFDPKERLSLNEFWKISEFSCKSEIGERKVRCMVDASSVERQGDENSINSNGDSNEIKDIDDSSIQLSDDSETGKSPKSKRGILKRMKMKVVKTMNSSSESEKEKEKDHILPIKPNPQAALRKSMSHGTFGDLGKSSSQSEIKQRDMNEPKQINKDVKLNVESNIKPKLEEKPEEKALKQELKKEEIKQDEVKSDLISLRLSNLEKQLSIFNGELKEITATQTKVNSNKSQGFVNSPYILLIVFLIAFILGYCVNRFK